MNCRVQPKAPFEPGFTLVELMIVVAIIGTLASVAIPTFSRYQLRSKTAEVKSNLAAIQLAEEAYFSEFTRYLAAAAEPALIPGDTSVPFNFSASDFQILGWSPEGRVFFSYAVAISLSETSFTADAASDLDGDGILQAWAYMNPGATDDRVDGALGCATAGLTAREISPCVSGAGTSTF